MKSEFLLAITQLAAQSNLPKDLIQGAVEAAMATAYKKDHPEAGQNVVAKIHPNTGDVRVYIQKTVVEEVTDPEKEISLDEAKKWKRDAAPGQTLSMEVPYPNPGRIAAQIAKQVLMQRLRQAERAAVLDEFIGRESDIVSGVVQRMEPRHIIVDLGRTEAILPPQEQVPADKYRIGERMRFYLLEVARTNKGPQVILSRSHRDFLRRLLELEVPEIYNGVVEIKAIARESGSRSKVAVTAKQKGVDPVGSCVGVRGLRIQNIVNELKGEKIDVIPWHENPGNFIASALSPAQVLSVHLDEGGKASMIVVPDRQLSLAIGKEGQNARLAAKLTGWKIDIKNATAFQEEQAKWAKKVAVEEKVAPAEVLAAPKLVPETPAVGEAAPREEEEIPVLELPVREKAPAQIRFAEEVPVPGKRGKEGKKGKKEEEGKKAQKGRKVKWVVEGEEGEAT